MNIKSVNLIYMIQPTRFRVGAGNKQEQKISRKSELIHVFHPEIEIITP